MIAGSLPVRCALRSRRRSRLRTGCGPRRVPPLPSVRWLELGRKVVDRVAVGAVRFDAFEPETAASQCRLGPGFDGEQGDAFHAVFSAGVAGLVGDELVGVVAGCDDAQAGFLDGVAVVVLLCRTADA